MFKIYFLLCLLCLMGTCKFALAHDNAAVYPTYGRIQQAQAREKTASDKNDRQVIIKGADQTLLPASAYPLQHMSGVTSSDPAQHPEIATPGDILIFISFSMPEASLRQWAEQAKRFHAHLIVRGLVNDSLAQTQAKIAQLFGEDNGGVVLEPRLFSDYQMTQVPAVVVRNTAMTCPITQNCSHVYPFDVVTGDIGLEDALVIIARQDGVATEVARSALHMGRESR